MQIHNGLWADDGTKKQNSNHDMHLWKEWELTTWKQSSSYAHNASKNQNIRQS